MASPKLAPGFFRRLLHHPVRFHMRRSTIELMVAFAALTALNIELPKVKSSAKAPPAYVLVPAPTTAAVPRPARTTTTAVRQVTTTAAPVTVPPTDTTTSIPATTTTTATTLVQPAATTTLPPTSTSTPPHP